MAATEKLHEKAAESKEQRAQRVRGFALMLKQALHVRSGLCAVCGPGVPAPTAKASKAAALHAQQYLLAAALAVARAHIVC